MTQLGQQNCRSEKNRIFFGGNNFSRLNFYNNFTLVELLVVISIIVILVSMLLPALFAARDKSKKIQCLSNMKQIGTAVSMYITDYGDYFPGSLASNHFFSDLRGYTGITPVKSDTTQSLGAAKIYWCPSDVYRATASLNYPNAYLCMFSYGVNSTCSWDAGEPQMQKVIRLKKPSMLLYLLDTERPEGYGQGFNFNTYPFKTSSDTTRCVDFRHQNMSNALWCDMHADSIRLRNMWGTYTTYTYQ